MNKWVSYLVALFLLALPNFSNADENISEFDRYMGKETSHWFHVKKTEDLEFLEKIGLLYEKNKELRFTAHGSYKIPPVIHFIWLGPNSFPSQSVENVRTWISKHPAWKIKFWTDRPRDPPCEGMEVVDVNHFPFLFLKKCFEESNNYGEKSDILRFEILYQEGGLYVDHDANCLQTFDPLHQAYDFYCGLETPHPPFVGLNITSGSGLIGSRSHHPVVKMVTSLIKENWQSIGEKFRGKDGYSRTQLVMHRTYIVLTQALKEVIGQEGNSDIVFPAAFFFAKKGVTPLYSTHFYANSWAEDDGDKDLQQMTKKTVQKMKHKQRLIRFWGLITLAVNILGFIAIVIYLKRNKKSMA